MSSCFTKAAYFRNTAISTAGLAAVSHLSLQKNRYLLRLLKLALSAEFYTEEMKKYSLSSVSISLFGLFCKLEEMIKYQDTRSACF